MTADRKGCAGGPSGTGMTSLRSALDVSMLFKTPFRGDPGPHVLADLFFRAGNLLRLEQHPLRLVPRNDEDPTELPKNDVARVDRHRPDLDRLLRRRHLPAADPIQRREVAIEDLQADLAQSLGIAEVPLEHHADATVLLGRVARQLAEVANIAVGGRDGNEHRIRRQPLEHLQVRLHTFGTRIPPNRWPRAPLYGEGLAHHPLLGKERPKAAREDLLWKAERVHRVAHGRHVERAVSAATLR